MPPIIQLRASAAYGVGLPKTCYWGLLYTLFWAIPEIAGCILLAGNMQLADVVHRAVMCCQSLGHCCRIYGKSNFLCCASRQSLVLQIVVFAECPCAMVESGFLAAACKHVPELLLLQFSFSFSRTGGLVPAWRASECLARNPTSHHTSNWILPVYLSGARTLNLSGEFFPIIVRFRGRCKSSQSVPAVEI